MSNAEPDLARARGRNHTAAADSRWLADDRLVRAGAVAFVAALTAASGQMSLPLPFTPIPVTLQPAVVLFGAAVLGARLGFVSQVVFLTAGLVGLPVFAAAPHLPPGPLRFLGPTAGYLLSYPIAALVTGALAARGFDRRFIPALGSMLAGLAVVYVGGVAWLAATVVATTGAGIVAALSSALAAGVYPFALLDGVKIAVAARALPAFRGLTGFGASGRRA